MQLWPQAQACVWVVEGESMGTAADVCDTFLTRAVSVHACFLGEAMFTGQNRAEQTKRQSVCVSFPFMDRFS